ncbi:hypothetical protein PPSIR1_36642 [Plesiocystis pacifica SIR-1]|uniref:Lipoprotein n=1 Tax=Plesiocystis pacifica SIR-1 TaxID=391625 RepID=A6G1N3_9BACT|nr:hypothetical protein [Plesiocystis pacifica]EDM80297.1 hypothetical protein PPSIR1_36642 [Plesiocystis pacifica SIR-1]
MANPNNPNSNTMMLAKSGALGLALLGLSALACQSLNQGASATGVDDAMSDVGDTETAEVDAGPEPRGPRMAELDWGRAPEGRLTEVVADPRAESALTLDQHGTVMLWPQLQAADGSQLHALSLPIFEPRAMSIAKPAGADAGRRYAIAHIDTTNTGHFGEVEVDAEGKGRYVERFTLPPSDPLFEVHALDGGERYLVLGIDHVLRLYDRTGKLLSALDEPGFGPWQIRMAGGVGEAPELAVVLAQPLRIQAISLADDQLRRVGEPQPFELDRGPNQNDLALSPDGKTIAGLRRPKAKTRQWSVELIDLEGGPRKLIAGRTTTLVRPRMHFVSATQLLLEHGDGRGTLVDLSLAEVPPHPEPRERRDEVGDLHPDSRFAERMSKRLSHTRVKLPGPTEEQNWERRIDDDQFERMHASVVNGVRLALDQKKPARVVVDGDVATEGHLDLGFPPIDVRMGALSPEGEEVAWAQRYSLRFDAVAKGRREAVDRSHGAAPEGMFYVSRDRALLVTSTSSRYYASLYDTATGEALVTERLEVDWGVAQLDYAPSADGSGLMVYRDSKPSSPLRSLAIVDGKLGENAALPKAEYEAWEGIRYNYKESVLGRLAEIDPDLDWSERELDEYTADRQGRWYLTFRSMATDLAIVSAEGTRFVELPPGQGRELEASPDGSLVAVVQFRSNGRFDVNEELQVSVIDSEAGERLWSQELFNRPDDPRRHRSVELEWSGDGARLLTVNAGDGRVFDARTGKQLRERTSEYIEVVEVKPETSE